MTNGCHLVFLCTGPVFKHSKSELQKIWYSNVSSIQKVGIQILTVPLDKLFVGAQKAVRSRFRYFGHVNQIKIGFHQTSSIFDFFCFSGFKDRGDQDESESEEEVDLNDDEKLLVKFD